MRFTVTLDPDVAMNLKKPMAAEKLTFKKAVNQSLLRGLHALDRQEKKNSKKATDEV